MIVSCPNCGARYRLSDEVVARGSRLKCAKCDHRWIPEATAEGMEPDVSVPEVAPGAPPEPVRSEAMAPDDNAVPEVPPTPDDAPEGDDGDEAEQAGRSPVLRSIAAIILGLALAIAAAGLWAGQIDLTRLPVVGPTLAGMMPASSRLEVTVAGKVTQLPAGGRVLDVTGTITNPGKRAQAVPVLKISLSGPTGNVHRWTISPPVARLAPGESATFASTVAGFPRDARTLSVTPGR